MATSTDPGHFFQSEAQLESAARKTAKKDNSAGAPIQLPSKILAVISHPTDVQSVVVAESAGNLRQVKLENDLPDHKRIETIYRGPQAPLTSIAVSPSGKHIFAGCWDNSIWSWDLKSRHPYKRYANGHSDFVKCVATAPLKLSGMNGSEVLLSGSQDATIVVWSILSGQKLHVLKGHGRGVLDILHDPYVSSLESARFWSAGSVGEILSWKITIDSAGPDELTLKSAHQTSVNRLKFEVDPDDEPDLWTASSDKTAKSLTRDQKFKVDLSLEHPDFVRDIAVDRSIGLVVTACRDEEVRVWEHATGKLIATLSGHWEEVTGVCFVRIDGKRHAISVGIDGTVRQWGLSRDELEKASVADQKAKPAEEPSQPPKQDVELTQEELDELFEDSD